MYDSPVGRITFACDCNAEKFTGLWIEGQKYHGSISDSVAVNDYVPLFCTVRSWLDRYFSGERPDINELPLAPEGSEFRHNVWKLLCKIPYGEVTTYKAIANEIARMMNRPAMSAQAVGGAVGHNPISIIIPCHRVIGSDRSLTGYAGGIETKLKLLMLEGVDTSGLTTYR